MLTSSSCHFTAQLGVHCSQPNTNRLDHLVTEKLLQRRMQTTSSCMWDTTHTNYTAYLHCPIYIQADLLPMVCAHVDLRRIMSTIRRSHHISFPENGGSTDQKRVGKSIGQVQDHTGVPGRQDRGRGQKCGILLVTASRPLRSID